MPRSLTPLIGRAGLITAVQDIIIRQGTLLLTLTGPGGVGKTRLALAIAANLAGHFGDGARVIDLSNLRDPNLVVAAIADQLGIDDRDSTPIGTKLAAALRDKRLLLVLDNFEHVLPARSDVLGLLDSCQHVVALVTSRIALRVRAEREFRVAPLEIPSLDEQVDDLEEFPSTALFLERARSAGFTLRPGDAPIVAEICRRLDGLPLAIELAAARIRVLPPADLLSRLSIPLPILAGGPHDLPDRQRTMRDAIEWSYRLLTPQQQGLFRSLSVFVGGFTLSAVESIEPDGAVLEDLSGLVEANLIQPANSASMARYTMLETIREYGRERLESPKESSTAESTSAVKAHAWYFVKFAESTDELQPDEGNIRAALHWTIANEEAGLALRLCAAMSGYWQRRGQLGEGLRWHSQALALPASEPVPVSIRLAALVGATKIATDVSAFNDAEIWADQAVALAMDTGIPQQQQVALTVRGGLATEQARYADATLDLERALTLADEQTDQAVLGETLIALSYVLLFTGDSERAEILADQGIAIIREQGDVRVLGKALRLLAWQHTHSGDYQRAEAAGMESLRLFRGIVDTGGTAAALRQLGATAALGGDMQLAVSRYEQALAIAQSRGDERQTYQLQAHLAGPALKSGDLLRARELALSSVAGARRLGDRWATGMSLTILGHVELADSGFDRARAIFEESSALMLVIGNPMYMSWSLEGMAGVEVARGQYENAAIFCAARDAHLRRLESRLPPLNPAGHQETQAAIGRHLDDQAIATMADLAGRRSIEELISAFRHAHGTGSDHGDTQVAVAARVSSVEGA